MSDIPKSLAKMRQDDVNREVLRMGMIAELDAVNLYEQLAAMASNPDIKKALLEIAGEEKTHMAEFETMLMRMDKKQVQENENGKKEVEDPVGRK